MFLQLCPVDIMKNAVNVILTISAMSLFLGDAKGECLYQGKLYMNHTLWLPDYCTICTCEDPLTVCEEVRCTAPNCDFSKGEYLQVPSDGCCPECVKQLLPCRHQGRTVSHNSEWKPDPCSRCVCYDSEVSCNVVNCPTLRCKPGQVNQQVPGQCCEICVPSGRTCSYDGQSYDDGSEWEPIPCSKCVCRDGQTTCYPIQCSPLVCPQDQRIERSEGSCCPKCVGQGCVEGVKEYKDGAQWRRDACTNCACFNGEIVCRYRECIPEMKCSKGKKNITRAGECCPECLPDGDLCASEQPVRYSGDIWNVSNCEFCVCKSGTVQCHKVVCEHITCKKNEEVVELPGKCCPECSTPPRCEFAGQTYFNNETWHPDPCSVCMCVGGETVCYHISCPVCPDGSTEIKQRGECCGKCQDFPCAQECAACRPDNASHCTRCVDQGMLLQEGKCVHQCNQGWYPTRHNECKGCHNTCSRCVDGTQHHCETCRPGLLWRNGQCVPRCGRNFYQDDKHCLGCDSSCSFCTGPDLSNCMSCSNPAQVLQNGYCVDTCQSNFYLRNRECQECPPTCRTCAMDGGSCMSCTTELILHRGQCLSECPPGFYTDQNSRCLACHPSCRSCTGPRDTQCSACLDGLRLGSRGRCQMPCQDGQFLHRNGSCIDCESGCNKCYPGESRRSSVCVACSSPTMVAFDSICIRYCPAGHYLQDQMCKECGGGCVQCDSPLACTKCGVALFLSGERCVRRCGHQQYSDWENQMCIDCPSNCLDCISDTECVQCDSLTFLKEGSCVSSCGRGYYENTLFRQCEENQYAPILQISGHIQLEEGGVTSIPADIFHLSDQDTPIEDLVLLLSQPPSNGRLVITTLGRDVDLQQQDTFTPEDLASGKIRFTHDASAGSKSRLVLRASDHQLVSQEQVLYIQAVSSDPPHLLINKPLLAHNGETTTFGSDTLDFEVSGQPEDIQISIVQGPNHGHIVHKTFNMPIKAFSLQELQTGRLGYQHGGDTDEEGDVMLLQVTDGYHILNFIININIRQKENKLPMIMKNEIGHVEAGAMLQITADLLSAKVMDKNNAPTNDIIYTLMPTVNNPKQGDVVMVVPMPSDGPGRGWENMKDGSMAAKMFRFMQRDIDEGRIWYKHKSTKASKSDVVTFEVADTSNPPNILRDQTFQVVIMDSAVTTSAPTIAPGVRLGMTILENQIVPISSSNLAYEDTDTPDDEIVYTVTRPLRREEGSIEHISSPFQSVTSFTQTDINNNRIVYRPPVSDIGLHQKEFSFFFTVSDGQDNEKQEQKFTVRVMPVNNIPPRFQRPLFSVSVSQGSTVPLGQSILSVTDADTPSSELSMKVIQGPRSGRIEKNFVGGVLVIREGESFLYSELVDSVLQYTHDGSSRPMQDQFRMEVSDGVHQSVVSINVTIIRVDKSSPMMLPAAVCMINIKEGETVVVRREVFGFQDGDDSDDSLRIILSSSPVHGKLLHSRGGLIQRQSVFTQGDINNGLISYTSDREIGPQSIREVLVVDVVDSSGNKLTNQVLSVIIEPVDNQAPIVHVGPGIQVEEGGEVPITVKDLRVSDPDSPLNRLTVTIHTPPVFGEVHTAKSEVSGSEETIERSVASFSVQDILDGQISYIQNNHKNKEPVRDGFLFIVSDGKNDSPTQRFNISIKLINDESPVMMTEQLFVREDHSVLLTNASLYLVDLDTPPDELMITVDSPPQHGAFVKKRAVTDPHTTGQTLTQGGKFTYQDVLNELILYRHSGVELSSDSITLTVTDGEITDTHTLDVIIGLVNDETPRVSINRGLRVSSGSTTPIKSKDLSCTDIDSDDSRLKYTIKRDPTGGRLRIHHRDRENPQVISTSGPVRTFLQVDIDLGLVEFQHRTGEITGVITFKFDVEDPEGNILIDQIFYITVLEDRIPPKMLTNRELLVAEGSEARITTDFLSFTDDDSEPGSLQYFLLSAPLYGRLELTDNPGVPVSEFTQSDLAANSLIYVHESSRELYTDRFTFTVTDGTNEVTHKFSIIISPVDNKIPVVTNNGLTVQEGIRKTITEFDLKAEDQDTQEENLLFQVIEAPLHGSVDLLRGADYISTSSFSMMDIYQGKISYQHDGSNSFLDNFSFTVTDGSNDMFSMQSDQTRGDISVPQTRPGEFNIEILPMDDGSPVLEINQGIQFLELSEQIAYNIITSRDLHAVDMDTIPANLVFMVTDIPQHGRLELISNPSTPIISFTQEDIDNGLVRYVLTGNIGQLEDSFAFDLVDKKPNIIPGNVFHIMWSVIGFERQKFNISETAGLIQLPVVRQGNIKQYSIVTCKTVPDTATSTNSRFMPGSADYIHHSGQVQFDEWQEAKVCTIIINDDSVYEGVEAFYVELEDPVYSLVDPTKHQAQVMIYDTDDEPVMEFEDEIFHVEEGDGFLSADISRTGDLESSVSVVCFTVPLTAKGSSLLSLDSGSDYISRGESNSYRVVFPPGVSSVPCEVKLVDDSDHETAEQFELVLSHPSTNAKLGLINRATVIIEGPNDVSGIHLSLQKYHFDENSGEVEIEVMRTGSDLSHDAMVWCATKLSEPPSATPGQDYIPSSSQITFSPGQRSERCRVTILDDDFDPRLEGNETFTVFLSSPTDGVLKEPYTATVYVHDSHLDMPKMEFVYNNMTVKETDLLVNVPITRSGDLSYESSVVCYTRQRSAEVTQDFVERPKNNISRLIFKPGEKTKDCTVMIVDDNTNEKDEVFNVHLGDAKGTEKCGAQVGLKNRTAVTVTNDEDEPTIEFEHAAYSVHEPGAVDKVFTVNIKILRAGDLSKESRIRCSTRDGSAVSGLDYNPRSQMITFEPGVDILDFPVDILHNSDIEWHESLSVVLGPEPPMGAVLGHVFYTTITILDDEVSGSLVFPAPPVVVSLLHYDDVESGMNTDPSPGYPLICVSACNEHYPTYTITHSLCKETGINQTAVLYRWEIGMPFDDTTGAKQPFVMVSDSTLFTSVDKIVLDSIYFRPSFRVRCIVQPLHENGNPGIPSKSQEVVISHESAICKSPVFHGTPNSYGAQSFLAKLSYVGPEHPAHPNTIHINIKIPHQDGHLPLISTYPLHNLEYLLAEPVYRQQHLCSNLITATERDGIIDSGFLDNSDMYPPSYKFPYQFDRSLRENQTIALYKHLNLKSCVWTFNAWYHMADLVDICGGRIISDFQVKNAGQTYLTVKVPLYVYYVYATAPIGWGSLQHHTEMEFSFYYDSILWQDGLEMEGDKEKIGGDIQVLKVLVGNDGKLVVDFKTHAKFRGLYVLSHHTLPEIQSRVLSPEGMPISIDLTLVWSQQTFDSPHQLWRASSNFNLKDYTGTYVIELLPCIVSPTQEYTSSDNPIPCTAHHPQRFEIPLAFQQSNRPVPLEYSLNTKFQLTSNPDMFLTRLAQEELDYDDGNSFSIGQEVYGRVLWNPDQDLKEAYKLSIQKVYLCTGRDGFVPTYDPQGNVYGEGPQFGCIQPSQQLRFRFLILDRGNPDVVKLDFQSVPFNAMFASDSTNLIELEEQPGTDGFILSVDPLFKVSTGNQWYLQVVYVIGKSDSTRHHYRKKRADDTTKQEVDGEVQGTNMITITLDIQDPQEDSSNLLPAILLPVVAIVIIILTVICCIVLYKRRRRKKDQSAKCAKMSNIEIARQNSLRHQNKPNNLSHSKCNNIKNTTVYKSERDRTCKVKIKNINIKTQGKRKLKGEKRSSGTEV